LVPIPFRADLRAFLTEFTDRHRGVRPGQMFGLPAGYVGRRLFVCVIEDGIIIRLPSDIARREIKGRGEPFSRDGKAASARIDTLRASRAGRGATRTRPWGSWVMYRPRTIVEARRLVPLLELAARHVAERQVEDLTGVRIGKRR
jgi:hypothetical protein